MLDKRLQRLRQFSEVAIRKCGERARILGQESLHLMPDEVDKRLLPLVGRRELLRQHFNVLALCNLALHTSNKENSAD